MSVDQPIDIRNSATGSIAALDGTPGTLDLNLNSNTDIVNNGIISGNGNLSLTAGGAIINAPENGGGAFAEGNGPRIFAGHNLSLQSSAIVNGGILNATAGNIDIADNLGSSASPLLVSIKGDGGTYWPATKIVNSVEVFGKLFELEAASGAECRSHLMRNCIFVVGMLDWKKASENYRE